jgi:hypothetical protein
LGTALAAFGSDLHSKAVSTAERRGNPTKELHVNNQQGQNKQDKSQQGSSAGQQDKSNQQSQSGRQDQQGSKGERQQSGSDLKQGNRDRSQDKSR